jgi:putative flippase GtrA
MARFLAVAVFGTVLDVSVVLTIRVAFGAPLLVAVGCGWIASVTAGFLLNRRVVFDDGRASLTRASGRYLVLVVLNALIGVGGVTAAVAHGVNYLLARVVSSTFLVTFNFLVNRNWVFDVAEPASVVYGAHEFLHPRDR